MAGHPELFEVDTSNGRFSSPSAVNSAASSNIATFSRIDQHTAIEQAYGSS
jgi:hypothetical protein